MNRSDTLIRVKINAVELLGEELSSLEPDVIACGDWQQPSVGLRALSLAGYPPCSWAAGS